MTRALTERNADIVRKSRGGATCADLAREYSISEQRVSQIVSRVRDESLRLPLTDREMALHLDLHRLNQLEETTLKRLENIVSLRIKTHQQLDELLTARMEQIDRRRHDDN